MEAGTSSARTIVASITIASARPTPICFRITTSPVPNAPITAIEEVMDLPFVKESGLRTKTPDGKIVRLPPPAVSTDYLESVDGLLPFAPAYGEDTDALLQELGYPQVEQEALRSAGVVA